MMRVCNGEMGVSDKVECNGNGCLVSDSKMWRRR